MKKILTFILLIVVPSGADAHCTWGHPGHCIGDVANAPVTVGTETAKVGEEQVDSLGGEVEPTGEGVAQGSEDIERTNENTIGDIARTLDKAAEDTERELETAGRDVHEATITIENFLERQAQALGKSSIPHVDKRGREENFVNAIWHLGTDDITYTEGNAAKLIQEHTLANVLAQVAASAYGGPQGAAAYAAWYTYRATGEVGLALQMGITVGATSTAMRAAGHMLTGTTDELVRKATVTGAIGGIGVAASGGDEDTIYESFLRSGGMVLVQDGYKKYTVHDNASQGTEAEAYCISSSIADCSLPTEAYIHNQDGSMVLHSNGQPKLDPRYLEARRPHIGIISPKEATGIVHQAVAEGGLGMDFTGKPVPVVQTGSVAHHQWVIQWDMSRAKNLATFVPVMVITYDGTDGAITDQILKTALTGEQRTIESDARQGSSNISLVRQIKGFVYTAFQCFKGKLTRVIQIDMLHNAERSVCRVLYRNEQGTSTLWHSKHNAGYCLPKGLVFVEKQISWGWSCYRI